MQPYVPPTPEEKKFFKSKEGKKLARLLKKTLDEAVEATGGWKDHPVYGKVASGKKLRDYLAQE